MSGKKLLKQYKMSKTSVNEMYVLVLWPESQELMDEEWFETEAILVQVEPTHTLGKESAAYLVPIKYIDKKISFVYEEDPKDIEQNTCKVCDKPIENNKAFCSERCFKLDLAELGYE